MFYFFALFICYLTCLTQLGESKLSIQDIYSNSTSDINIYSGTPWNINPVKSLGKSFPAFASPEPVPIIRIDKQFQQFNPCDESTFKPANIMPLLLDINLTVSEMNSSFSFKNGWIAMVEGDTMVQSQCNNIIPYHLLYVPHIALSAQKLGASGVIYMATKVAGGQTAARLVSVYPSDVDVTKRQVDGTEINIAVIIAERVNYYVDGSSFDVSSSKFQWVIPSPLLNPESNQKQEFDRNPYSDIWEPFGAYRIILLLCLVLCFTIAAFGAIYVLKVVEYYQDKKDKISQSAFLLRLLILIPEFIAQIARGIHCIDPFGVFNIIGYFNARLLANVANSLTLITDVATILYCYDVYRVFKASAKLQSESTLLLKYRSAMVFIVVVMVVIMIVELGVTYFGLSGQLGGSVILLPALYVLSLNLFFVIASLRIGKMMKTAVKECMSSRSPVDAPRSHVITPVSAHKSSLDKVLVQPSNESGGISNSATAKVNLRSKQSSNAEINCKLKKLLRLRSYLRLAAYSRLLYILALILIASNWIYRVAFNYALTVIILFYGSTFSSLFQVTAALQLVVTKEKKVGVANLEG